MEIYINRWLRQIDIQISWNKTERNYSWSGDQLFRIFIRVLCFANITHKLNQLFNLLGGILFKVETRMRDENKIMFSNSCFCATYLISNKLHNCHSPPVLLGFTYIFKYSFGEVFFGNYFFYHIERELLKLDISVWIDIPLSDSKQQVWNLSVAEKYESIL